jgi:light-regulated signal transduction histidine kinase (bacteriophytochrome)
MRHLSRFMSYACCGRCVGYDRVMIYKFHEDQHGEVVAAMSAEGVPSYFGLHWPATDLPQVRSSCICPSHGVALRPSSNAQPQHVNTASGSLTDVLESARRSRPFQLGRFWLLEVVFNKARTSDD